MQNGFPGSPDEAVVWCGIESTVTALLGEAALFTPCYEYCSAIPQSRQAILTALYRDSALPALTQTVLSENPYYCMTTTASSIRGRPEAAGLRDVSETNKKRAGTCKACARVRPKYI